MTTTPATSGATESAAPVRAPTAAPHGETPGRRTVTLWTAAVFAVGLAGALLMYHQLWVDPFHRTLGGEARHNDPLQSMWFLKSVPWQLLHGHDPLRSDGIFFPVGVNLAWNTSTPTLALLVAPITMLAGATFSFAFLMTIAPAAAAATSFLWLRRHVSCLPAAVVGGLVVGFSPFMAGHLKGHLHLVFIALIPLMLMLLEDILWRHPRPDRRSAVYLGIVTAAQAGISEELIVLTAIGVELALVGYLLVDARGVWVALRSAVRPIGIAVVAALVVASPLLIEQLVVGDFIHMHNAVWRATVTDYLRPSGNTVVRGFGHGHLNIGSGEDGVYLGPVLLAVLVGGVLISARDRLVRCAVVALAVLVALSFGDIEVMGINLPWHYLQHLPGLSAVLPVRLSFASWLVIGWLIAHWLDRLRGSIVAPARSRRIVAVAGIAALAGALATIVPNAVDVTTLPSVPRALTHPPAGVPAGSPVLLLPAATPHDAVAMYFQQAANFRFVMPSGYGYRKSIDQGTLWAPQTPLERMSELPSRVNSADLANARDELARRRYREVVVVSGLPDSQRSRDFATLLIGRPPDQVDDQTSVWLLPG
jgi:hypothetical protein